jgi:hypothetical protein
MSSCIDTIARGESCQNSPALLIYIHGDYNKFSSWNRLPRHAGVEERCVLGKVTLPNLLHLFLPIPAMILTPYIHRISGANFR